MVFSVSNSQLLPEVLKGIESKATVLPQEGVLVIAAVLSGLAHQTSGRNEFDVDLHTLARTIHLLVRLGEVLGVWQLYRHPASFSQKSVQDGDGPGIAPLAELDPEYHDPTVRTMGTIRQGLQPSVISLSPAVDVPTVGLIPDRCLIDKPTRDLVKDGKGY